jgi:hypothetical protein
MPPVGFQPTISVLERAKTVHALNRVATVIGRLWYREMKCLPLKPNKCECIVIKLKGKLKKLRGLSPRANYTDQATAACRRR